MSQCCGRVVRVRLWLSYTLFSALLHFSAAVVFGVRHHLYAISLWACIGGLYAVAVSSLHWGTLNRSATTHPSHMILPALLLTAILGMIFSMGLFFYAIARAVAANESPFDVTSHYILGVWTFLSFKWSVCLFHQTRRHGTETSSSLSEDQEEEDRVPILAVVEEEEDESLLGDEDGEGRSEEGEGRSEDQTSVDVPETEISEDPA